MNVELAQAATVFDVLCDVLMISMQFVQVRSQNRSVPSRGGRYGKNII